MALDAILWREGVHPQDGTIGPVDTGPGPDPGTVPDAPTDVSAVGGRSQAIVSFTPPENNGGSAILLYTVTSSPGGFTASGTSSPIIVPYLSNNTSYTFTVVATNIVGDSVSSSASNSITTTTPTSSSPTITGINALTTSFIVTFTAPSSFGTITNYEYSTDGGVTFTALSPTDAVSPITIPSLTPTTTYSVAIRAINNVPATGDPSNIVPVATASQQITVNFTTVGTTSWTPPANVRYVQYLCVAGGGGGGAAYSKITVLPGIIPVLTTVPAAGSGYWISKAAYDGNRSPGRMYNGTSLPYLTFSDPVRCTASETLAVAGSGSWRTFEVVYNLSNGYPNETNVGYPSYIVSSTYNNNASGGGGGGAYGQIKATFGAADFYSVTPRSPYTIIVGDGGEGGVGGPNSEAEGSKGGDSTFATITSTGGSGGRASRDTNFGPPQNYIQNGYSIGGRGQTTASTLIGGYGGQGYGGTGGQGLARTGGSAGGTASVAPNFSGSYGPGGTGGAPNTVATGVTTPNIGAGGSGTGAALNSFASGIKGGTGVVILKYYI